VDPLTLLRKLPESQEANSEVAAPRKIASQPYKVLDAPNLVDDFYLNLVDWSPNNQLAVALGSIVYV